MTTTELLAIFLAAMLGMIAGCIIGRALANEMPSRKYCEHCRRWLK